jgi:uncharacterized protein (DUF362 family)/Pyruvate/2-oxoacid:ferredoxin oxidoreductase delta subunit
MTKVFIRNARYDTDGIRPIIQEMFDSMGPDWIMPGMRVVIKPNMLMAAAPEQAIVTHPLIVRSVAAYMLGKGAEVQVSDSPPIGSFHKLIRQSGYDDALKDLDVALKPFEQCVKVDIGAPFGAIEVAREAVEADRVINLAKLKSHAMMYLSLGVKNMFGTIVGLRKPEWHMRSGVDRAMFAQLLVQIYETVAPAFTLVDGITAMQGQGPGRSGIPRELGLLIGGAQGHAVDKTVCTLLGLHPDELLTYRTARELNRFDGIVHVDGNMHIVDDYLFPQLNSLSLGPEALNRFMRRYVIQKPVVDNGKCKLCGECWKVCPADVISHDTKGISFEYGNCIRCYCCLEICSEGAIEAKEPLLGKLRRRLIRGKKQDDERKDSHGRSE